MANTVLKKANAESAPVLYSTPDDYTPGTLNVFINGRLRVPENDDGFIEIDSRKFQLKEPSDPCDDIQCLYETQSSVINNSLEGITFPLRVRLNGHRFTTSIRYVR